MCLCVCECVCLCVCVCRINIVSSLSPLWVVTFGLNDADQRSKLSGIMHRSSLTFTQLDT